MKIVFIETASSHLHVYSRIHIPRLGCILLGTILKERGYDVNVFVEDLGPIDPQIVQEADIVGISTLTPTASRSYQLAQELREAGKTVILGGPHVTFEADEALNYADYVVRGEGEETIVELLEALKNRSDFSKILGLSYRENGEARHNPQRPLVKDLDRYPIPDFSLLHSSVSRQSVVSLMTTRGCPFDCSFCSVTAFNGRRFRANSVDRVLREVSLQTERWRPGYVFFADDNFDFKRNRTKEIVRGLADIKRLPRWGAQVRHEVSRDQELLKLMQQAHCDRVFVGFESVNPLTLERYNKQETVEDIVHAVKAFHAHDIKIHGMFIVGSDEDTVETIHATKEFAFKHRIDSVQFLILTPLPGARYYQEIVGSGRKVLTKQWEMYDGHHVITQPAQMTTYELQYETLNAMRKFYSIPRILNCLVRRDWFETVYRWEGHSIVRSWFKKNKEYLQQMRQKEALEVQPMAGAVSKSGRQWSIAISTTDLSPQARQMILTFFAELGVKVVEAKRSVAEVCSGLAKSKDRANHAIYEYLESFRGEVDAVALPRIEGLETLWGRLSAEVGEISDSVRSRISRLPQIIQLPNEPLTPACRQTLTRIGLIFTDDLNRIRMALSKATNPVLA
ncbi:MAG: radical SAM protein [bacterium]